MKKIIAFSLKITFFAFLIIISIDSVYTPNPSFAEKDVQAISQTISMSTP